MAGLISHNTEPALPEPIRTDQNSPEGAHALSTEHTEARASVSELTGRWELAMIGFTGRGTTSRAKNAPPAAPAA